MGNFYTMIPFNKPYLTGEEITCIQAALQAGKTCGNGTYTQKCQHFFEQKFPDSKCLLTTSCTDALEMCAILADIHPGDEVILPSYTFVSTALAFVRQGAKIVFVDSRPDLPGIDETQIEALITPRTKAIVVVHYAGVSCHMDVVMALADKYGLLVIEDAAQAIDSFYKGRPLGNIGHLSALSFHETKNIQCGEGGMLVVNADHLKKRAEVVWEKGTNRAEFFRGEINKYGWVDLGSSFLPAEYVAAFLWSQLEHFEQIQARRKIIWEKYYQGLKGIENLRLPYLPDYATNNGHIFYLLCRSLQERVELIEYLKEKGVHTVFHSLSLHKCIFIEKQGAEIRDLPYADFYTDCLLRLPFFYELTDEEIDYIVKCIKDFYFHRA